MLLSVQDQFVPKIQDGTKPFSIRSFRKDGRIPKPGEKIFMYHGSRYKKGKRPRVFPQGMEPTISWVGKIIIPRNDRKIKFIRIESLPIYKSIASPFETPTYPLFNSSQITFRYQLIRNINEFAKMDGFNCFADQLAFFKKFYGLPFSGLIIFWKLHPECLRMRGIS